MVSNDKVRVLVLGLHQGMMSNILAALREVGYEAEGTTQIDQLVEQARSFAPAILIIGGGIPPVMREQAIAQIQAIDAGIKTVDGRPGIAYLRHLINEALA